MSSPKQVRVMLLISHSLNIISDEELLLLMAENSSRKSSFPYDEYDRFSLDDMEESACKSEFRFEKSDIPLLAGALGLPEMFRCSRRTAVGNIEGLCLVLKQMTSPCRYSDLVPRFGRPIPELRMITNKVIDYLYNVHGHRITEWNQQLLSPAHLQRYADVISSKGGKLDNCFGFVDCPVRPNHRKVFNGQKRVYSLKYQSVILPNGLIAHMYGPIEGKKHDTSILNDSHLLRDLEQFAFSPNGHPMCLYGNPSYPIRVHLQAPFKNAVLTQDKEAYNRSMNKVKTSVEWIFGDVINSFKFLDFKNNHKITLTTMVKMHVVCSLVQNALTRIHGNQTSKLFNLDPPTIQEYFS